MIPVRDGLAHPDLFTPELIAFFDGHVPPDPVAAAGEPFVGVTTDGAPIGGLNTLSDDGFDNRAAVAAATTFLSTLTAAERAQAQRPMSSPHWRM
jgi:hypothetical protein